MKKFKWKRCKNCVNMQWFTLDEKERHRIFGELTDGTCRFLEISVGSNDRCKNFEYDDTDNNIQKRKYNSGYRKSIF